MLSIHRTFTSALVALAIGGAFLPAHAAGSARHQTEVLRGSSFTVNGGQTETLELEEWRHIKKLFVQAEGSWGEGMIDVIVNGDTKGTIHVPGRDPSFVVTVSEAAGSIEFRHLSGAPVYIRSVSAVMQGGGLFPVHGGHGRIALPATSTATEIASRAMSLVEDLRYYSTDRDFSVYLLPIRTSAGRLYAIAKGRGDLAWRSRQALVALKAQIDFAHKYIAESFTRDATFALATELLSLSERIDQILY